MREEELLTWRCSGSGDSLDNDGSKFIAQTNKDAPNWKVVTFDLADEKVEFKELIPHDPDAVLGSVSVIRDDLLIVTYSRDVSREACPF